ncbi:MAG: TRAP transporter small permease [Synergistaceae bacterium]|nr:TRAP transporter small permease [Synergistaceae bacterium]
MTFIFDSIATVDRWVLKIEKLLLCLAIPVMILMGALQILSRFVIQTPIPWSEGLLTFLFVWTSFVGASLALAGRTHFQVDLFTLFFPPYVQKILDIIVDITVFGFCIFLVLEGNFLMWKNSRQIIGLLQISIFWGFLCLPFSGGCMLLHTLTHLIQTLRGKN